jgi:hypothetical protein
MMFLPNDLRVLQNRPSRYRLADIPWNREDEMAVYFDANPGHPCNSRGRDAST